MAKQAETIKVVTPLRDYMTNLGWKCIKTHGNQYQSALPDLYCFHPKYEPRWIECKILYPSGSGFTVHMSESQIHKWPSWIANGMKIWMACGVDLRGEKGLTYVKHEYKRLFKAPDAYMFLNSSARKLVMERYAWIKN